MLYSSSGTTSAFPTSATMSSMTSSLSARVSISSATTNSSSTPQSSQMNSSTKSLVSLGGMDISPATSSSQTSEASSESPQPPTSPTPTPTPAPTETTEQSAPPATTSDGWVAACERCHDAVQACLVECRRVDHFCAKSCTCDKAQQNPDCTGCEIPCNS